MTWQHHNILPKWNIQVWLWLKSNSMKDQLLDHIAIGGNITEANQLTGRREGQVANRSVEFQSFQVDTKGAMGLVGRQSVLPHRISTPSQTEIKSISNNRYCSSTSRTSTPSQSEISGFLAKHPYYQPQEDQETYYINSEGPSPVPQRLTEHYQSPHPPGASRVKGAPYSFTNLAQSRSAVWRTFLNFILTVSDRLGSLKGRVWHQGWPNSATSTPCEEEGVNRKQGSNQGGHWLYGETRHFGATDRSQHHGYLQ